MKALLMVCLAAVLCVGVVNTLKCYTCSNRTRNEQCLTSDTCAKNDTACLTTVERRGTGSQQSMLINKRCVTTCGVFQNIFECCHQDNCNANEASGMRPSLALLGTALVIGATRTLLWTEL